MFQYHSFAARQHRYRTLSHGSMFWRLPMLVVTITLWFVCSTLSVDMTAFYNLEIDESLGASVDFEDCFDLPWSSFVEPSPTSTVFLSTPMSSSLPAQGDSLVAASLVHRPKFIPKGRQALCHVNYKGP